MGKTLGILSLKGGVGKTSAVLSLGSAIAGLGRRVLLVDGNFSAPNLGIHLNIIEPETTVHHVLNGDGKIEDAIITLDDFNFDILPASIIYRSRINPFKLKEKIRLLRDRYDIIIIDSSPALNDETLAVMLASDEIFIVTTPDYPTLSMTMKAIKDAKTRGIKVNGLILNKVYNKPFELSIGQIEETSGVPVLAVIPEDIEVVKSLSTFTPSVINNPKSRGSMEYKKLAGVIIGEKQKPSGLWNLFKSPQRQEVNRELFYQSFFRD